VNVAEQRLELLEDGHPVFAFPISTSAYGLGSEEGSLKTPLGRFGVAEKIGNGQPQGMVFRGRVPTGEIGTEDQPDDLVETRILWLEGLEPHNANTHSRYIYIHGTNHESRIGTPASHGCVRMRNADIVTLFDAVEVGDEILIRP
jgi:lipoprotein-anchoring transpeptidase ErfK/SrfK